MNNEEKLYIPLGGWLRLGYAYVDVNPNGDRYLADSLFYKRRIPVKFKGEMVRDKDKYQVVFCTIKKKDRKAFEEALDEIPVKMDLLGHLDYRAYCRKLIDNLNLMKSTEKKTE